MEKLQLVITFLEKGFVFDPDSPLVIKSIANGADSSLLAKFREYGFVPSQNTMYLLACHAFAYHNFDIIKFLLESKFIVPNQKYSTKVPDNFEGRSFINYLLSCSATGQIRYRQTINFTGVYKTQLTKILKLFLDYGFTFSVNGPPIVLSPFACN